MTPKIRYLSDLLPALAPLLQELQTHPDLIDRQVTVTEQESMLILCVPVSPPGDPVYLALTGQLGEADK